MVGERHPNHWYCDAVALGLMKTKLCGLGSSPRYPKAMVLALSQIIDLILGPFETPWPRLHLTQASVMWVYFSWLRCFSEE